MRGEHKRKKARARTRRGNPSNKLVAAVELDSVELRCRRKWRTSLPMGGGVNAAVALLQWRVYHVPYLSGRFTVVPRAASRPSSASQWGNSLGGLLPAAGRLRRQHALGSRSPVHGWLPGGSTRLLFSGLGRRRMGSVGSWPLAKLLAQQREVTANESAVIFGLQGLASPSSPWGHPRPHPAA
jgi:hypothetical protein